MKLPIIFYLLLLPFLAVCQVQDTTIFEKTENGIQVVRTIQQSPVSVPALVKLFTEKALAETNRYATDIGYTRLYSPELNKLRTTASDIQKQTDVNPLDSIDASELYKASWVLKGGDKPIAVTFKAKGGGIIQWKADTSATWRQAVYFGSAIRLLKFNGGKVDLWRSVPGGYCSADNTFVLKPDTGGKREVSAAPDAEEPPETLFYPAGVIQHNGAFYKYSPQKKTWVKASKPSTSPITLK